MNMINPPVVNYEDINSITEVVKESEELIMHTAKLCRKAQRHRVINNDISYWERLMASNDSNSVWHAIDWKGQCTMYNKQALTQQTLNSNNILNLCVIMRTNQISVIW